MRIPAVLILAVLACSAACAQSEKPPMDLPVYPGGSSTMEINMTSEELLTMVQAMVPLAGEKLGKLAEALNPDAIADILKDVKRIEYLQVDVAQPGVKEEQIGSFYAKNLPPGKWSRVLWVAGNPSGTTALYSQAGAEQLYGFRINTVKTEDKTVKRVDVLKIEGKIDYIKALQLAVKLGIARLQPPS